MGIWVIQSAGTGTFGAPNTSSVLSTVEQKRYGVVSSFLNMVRNAGNVTGIALATAIVAGIMVSKGLPPTLSAVSEANATGVLPAFTSGMRTAYVVTGILVLFGVLLAFLSGGQTERAQDERPGKSGPTGASNHERAP